MTAWHDDNGFCSVDPIKIYVKSTKNATHDFRLIEEERVVYCTRQKS